MKMRDFTAVSFLLLCAALSMCVSAGAAVNQFGVESDNPYVVSREEVDGDVIETIIVPGRPPEFYRAPVAVPPEPDVRRGTNTVSEVPIFDWSYGCAATSAAMLFGCYDRKGYPKMYSGPTNGGVCPLTNITWGSTTYPSVTCGECPLSATHKGIDGRTSRGHVDDYWIDYGNPGDPYITGGWAEHAPGICTGDFMGTNQSKYSNTDGSTWFSWWVSGKPMYDDTSKEPSGRDGCHGMKLFVQSRGYKVPSQGNFTQLIQGAAGTDPGEGFTFADYKAEINAGRPVLIQVVGHTMLGVGYDDPSTVYLHDTWDHSVHSMTWGGTYPNPSGPPMKHQAVTVCRVTGGGPPPTPQPTPKPVPVYRWGEWLGLSVDISSIPTYYWGYYGYSRCIMPNGNMLSIFNNRISPYRGPLVYFYGLPYGFSGTVFRGYIPYGIPTGEYMFEIIIVKADRYQSINNATLYSNFKINIQP